MKLSTRYHIQGQLNDVDGTAYLATKPPGTQLLFIREEDMGENVSKESHLRQDSIKMLLRAPNAHIQLPRELSCEGTKFFTVSDFAQGRDLASFLEGTQWKGDGSPEPIIAQIATQILEGIAAMHGAAIVHRAVSARHVLVYPDSKAPELFPYRLALSGLRYCVQEDQIDPFTDSLTLQQQLDAVRPGPREEARRQAIQAPERAVGVKRRAQAELGAGDSPPCGRSSNSTIQFPTHASTSMPELR